MADPCCLLRTARDGSWGVSLPAEAAGAGSRKESERGGVPLVWNGSRGQRGTRLNLSVKPWAVRRTSLPGSVSALTIQVRKRPPLFVRKSGVVSQPRSRRLLWSEVPLERQGTPWTSK
ncbi:hypothetical protein DIPPA_33359 [Diplonema papillatum]|nr:hypothetical protein DIPPA_33359 [Diplonema papillatum]